MRGHWVVSYGNGHCALKDSQPLARGGLNDKKATPGNNLELSNTQRVKATHRAHRAVHTQVSEHACAYISTHSCTHMHCRGGSISPHALDPGATQPQQAQPLTQQPQQRQQQQPAPTMDSLDVSAGEMSVCAAAWRTHMVVFSSPWEDSVVEMLAVYTCAEVSMGVGMPERAWGCSCALAL